MDMLIHGICIYLYVCVKIFNYHLENCVNECVLQAVKATSNEYVKTLHFKYYCKANVWNIKDSLIKNA